MKKTLIAAAALVAMVGCNKTLIESSPAADSNYGYINLGVSADTEMVVTKAESEFDNYNVTVTNTATSSSETREYSAAKEGWKVPAGTYSVSVVNLGVAEAYDAAGKGQLRVGGITAENVVVESGFSKSCTVHCTPINSKVSFLYTEKFSNLFGTSNTVTVSNVAADQYPARNFLMNITAAENSDEAAFFEPSSHNWSLTVNSALNGEKTYTKEFTPKAGSWTQITFDAGTADGSISITITEDKEIKETLSITATVDPTGEDDVTVTDPTVKQ